MKIHPPLLSAVRQVLNTIFQDGRPADRALESVFKGQKKLGSRDRKFIAETVYECVRWSRRWRAVAEKADLLQGEDLGELLVYASLQGWGESVGLNPSQIQRLCDLDRGMTEARRDLRESILPDVDLIAAQELGERWDEELEALNEKAPVDLRVNTYWKNRDQVRAQLKEEGILTELVQSAPDALTLPERKNVFVTKTFHSGYFEVQDRSSQHVAPFAKLEGASRVIDACAGAGGKTLHIANLLKNKGRVISLDIHAWKLKELEERARRSRFSNIETRLIDSTKVIKRLEESGDRVLLDVPCSGLGVLRRNPDSKLRLNQAEIERMRALQAEILASYSRMVKPGGYLVYSTCSILPSENTQQIHRFLESHPTGWEFEEEWSAFPSARDGDGFYAARLKRLKV